MDEAIDNLLAILEEMLLNGEDIPDELLAEIEELLLEYIEDLKRITKGGPQLPPEVPTAEYPSSNIYGFRFDPKSKKLLIKFMGKDTAESGPVYEYDDIPPFIFEVIRRGAVAPKTTGRNKYHAWYKGKTPSHGASVHALVKQGGYNYRKVA